ncbi:unnamed protein product, partial [Anisakis simplex]|uniref:LAGLIDADG_2 domain-containing protein n=1 Tax=Anisakis simplex TaxID=6269 RepID=A0A0M3K9F4_ANISI
MVRASPRPLPATGVRDADGTLIYHRARAAPCRRVVERMEQCGVEIRKGHFTEKEDEILRKNWSMFAQKHGLDDDAAFEYSGGYSYEKMKNGDFQKHVKKLFDMQFVPNMCRGLDQRTGYQVIWRLHYLFRPRDQNLSKYTDWKIINKWTPERLETLKELVKLGFGPLEIVHRMQISRDSVVYHMRKLGLDEAFDESTYDSTPLKEMTANERAYFFKYITYAAGRSTAQRYPSLSAVLELFESKEEIDYAVVALNMTAVRMTASQAKRYWLYEGEKLKKAYEECGRNMNRVSRLYNLPSRRMNTLEWQRTVAIIREQNPVNVRDIDKNLVHQRMMEEGLTGFYTRGYKEGYYAVEKFLMVRSRCLLALRKDIPVIDELTCRDLADVMIEYSKATHWKFYRELRHVVRGNMDKLKAVVIKQLQAAGISLEQVPNYKEMLARGNAYVLPHFSDDDDDDNDDDDDDDMLDELQHAATTSFNRTDNEMAYHTEGMMNDADGALEGTSNEIDYYDVVESNSAKNFCDGIIEISKNELEEQRSERENDTGKENDVWSECDVKDEIKTKRKHSNRLKDNNENEVSTGDNDNEFGKDEEISADLKRRKKKEKRDANGINDRQSPAPTSYFGFIKVDSSAERENIAKKSEKNDKRHSKKGESGGNVAVVASESDLSENERKRLKKLKRDKRKEREARRRIASDSIQENSFGVDGENAKLTNKQHKKSKKRNHSHISDCGIEQSSAAVTGEGGCTETCKKTSGKRWHSQTDEIINESTNETDEKERKRLK